MKNTFGNSVAVTLFGESHGEYIGATLDGLAPGIEINGEYIKNMLSLRRSSAAISTPRRESDEYKIISGVLNGVTTGTPITVLIPNQSTNGGDYSQMQTLARPSHADYTAECKYHGYQDVRGGGHFSGRITAALVAVGAICRYALEQKGIFIGTHLKRCAGIEDRDFCNISEDIKAINEKIFSVLDDNLAVSMQEAILAAKADGDSVGGVLETAVVGVPAGVGEPWFDTVEGMLAHIVFSVPAVKGIEFGAGFAISEMRGSESNDELCINGGKVETKTNNSGGINGGITNGMPIIFRTAIKPTPTIFKPQATIDYKLGREAILVPEGRHDPAIVHRARTVIDAVSAIVICDALSLRYGTDFLK